MRVKFYGLLAAAALAVAVVPAASAASLCTSGTSDVTAGGYSCTEGGLLFSNFTVSASSGFTGATVGLTAGPPTTVVGNDVDLGFQIGGLSGSGVVTADGDIELQYVVAGGVGGVDITLQSSPVTSGGSETVTEIACTGAFVGGVCSGITLANYTVVSSGNVAVNQQYPWLVSPNYTGPVYIKKDLSYDGATTSELVNSQIMVPEPMTLSLMGAGLLGLGLMGRRLRK